MCWRGLALGVVACVLSSGGACSEHQSMPVLDRTDADPGDASVEGWSVEVVEADGGGVDFIVTSPHGFPEVQQPWVLVVGDCVIRDIRPLNSIQAVFHVDDISLLPDRGEVWCGQDGGYRGLYPRSGALMVFDKAAFLAER